MIIFIYYLLEENLRKHTKQQSHLEAARKKAQKSTGKHSAIVKTESTA